MRVAHQFDKSLRLEGHGQVKKLFLLLHLHAFNTESSPITDFGF